MIQNVLIAAALAAADDNSLISLANKGLFNRACKDTEGVSAEYSERDGGVALTVGGEECLIKAPLSDSRCSCPARGICRHILGGIIILRRELYGSSAAVQASPERQELTEAPEPTPQPESEPQTENASKGTPLSAADAKAVRECCADGLSVLGGVLARGLVRSDASMADRLELTAVRAHAAKMADAERLLRGIGGKLNNAAARRASFDAGAFIRQIGECTSLLLRLSREGVTEEELGSFRKTYEPYGGDLTLLPIGKHEVIGDEYSGGIYYFLNTDRSAKERILTYSDLRPTFYENSSKARRTRPHIWDMSITLDTAMRDRMVLSGARLCGRQLSGSNETKVLSKKKAVLTCPEMLEMLIDDFREIVCAFAEDSKEDKLFLITPASMPQFGFDRHQQVFSMTLEDKNGRRIAALVKYSAELKQHIADLEKSCETIGKLHGKWSMLASARIVDGRVVLFPIEIYDFLKGTGAHSFEPPEQAGPNAAAHAEQLLKLIAEVEERLVHAIRSGLTSAQEDSTALVGQLERCGLVTLAELSKGFFEVAESYRHSTGDGGENTLIKMAALMEYITIAKRKLGLISAMDI